jgi:hypothetical protein
MAVRRRHLHCGLAIGDCRLADCRLRNSAHVEAEQSPILNQSIRNPQSAIRQSAIANRQSAMSRFVK